MLSAALNFIAGIYDGSDTPTNYKNCFRLQESRKMVGIHETRISRYGK
jgi:hypothetical protein